MPASPTKLSRKQLYQQVWETPIHRLSVKYGLSDVGLAKACKRMNIPRPPRGYWRRLQTGARVGKTPLPAATDDTQLEITFHHVGELPAKRIVKHQPRVPARNPIVEETLSEPHTLIAAAKVRLEEAKEDRYGIVVPKHKLILEIRVGRESVDRCLRLLDTLTKSWEAEGHAVKLVKGEDSSVQTYLCGEDDRLRIRIEEGVEEYDPGPEEDEKLHPKWEWKKRTACRSTGQVTIRLEGDRVTETRRFSRRFQDREGDPVEQKARQIWSAGMDYFAQREQYKIRKEQRRIAEEQRQRQWELERQLREEEWARQREEERRRQEEQRKVQELSHAAADWARARQVRDFIAACESRMQYDGVAEDEITAWKEWALAAAEKIDPLVSGYPGLHSNDSED